MHSYGEIIVDVNTMMTLDLNADINGEIGVNLRPGLNAY